MAVIKVTDIAYIRLRSPDLDLQAEFLDNFGLVPSEKTGKAIYYRGTDPVHHLHITEKREPIDDADWMAATRARCSTSTHRHRCSRISDEGEIVARKPSLESCTTLRVTGETGCVTATEKNRGVGLP